MTEYKYNDDVFCPFDSVPNDILDLILVRAERTTHRTQNENCRGYSIPLVCKGWKAWFDKNKEIRNAEDDPYRKPVRMGIACLLYELNKGENGIFTEIRMLSNGGQWANVIIQPATDGFFTVKMYGPPFSVWRHSDWNVVLKGWKPYWLGSPFTHRDLPASVLPELVDFMSILIGWKVVPRVKVNPKCGSVYDSRLTSFVSHCHGECDFSRLRRLYPTDEWMELFSPVLQWISEAKNEPRVGSLL